jgi:archaellum component FlaF (FlaF/FlaG flagellin family)
MFSDQTVPCLCYSLAICSNLSVCNFAAIQLNKFSSLLVAYLYQAYCRCTCLKLSNETGDAVQTTRDSCYADIVVPASCVQSTDSSYSCCDINFYCVGVTGISVSDSDAIVGDNSCLVPSDNQA